MSKLAKEEMTSISFFVSNGTLDKLENHIDKTKIALRKAKGGRKPFTKKQMYQFLFECGIKNFDLKEFETKLQNEAV